MKDKNVVQFLAAFSKIEKRLKKRKFRCMFPGCDCDAIGSHSQQEHGPLHFIAENQHVMAMDRNMQRLLYKSSALAPPELSVRKIGIHEASKFNGFCNDHDRSVFSIIETTPLICDNADQALAFHRRAVAYEMWNKQLVIDLHRAVHNEVGEDGGFWMSLIPDLEKLLEADKKYAWLPLWDDNADKAFRYHWRRINKNIGVSLASCITPLDDNSFEAYMASCFDAASGEYNHARPFFSLSIVPGDSVTDVVFCWNECNDVNVVPWGERFRTTSDLALFLNECVFCKSEDYCMRPSLWESLPEDMQRNIRTNLYMCGSDNIPNVITL